MNPETKTTLTKQFSLKTPMLVENTIAGAANVMGEIDRGGDVVFPGFFTPALPGFLKQGIVPVGHKWDELPVAMPTLAEERGNELYCEATFHSTNAAQDARTVARERLAGGLTMGLSVGFSFLDGACKLFKDGAALLAYAKELGCDMALFNTAQISAYKGVLRGLLPGGCDELFEYSIVPVPMNALAGAANVKRHRREEADLNAVTTESKPDAEVKTTAAEAKDLAQGDGGGMVTKSQYLGDVERSMTTAAFSTLSSALMQTVYRALYDEETTSASDLVVALSPAFDEYRDLSLATIDTLLASVDWEELREDASSWYDYYSKPATERAEIAFSEKAAALVTGTADFIALASRRQDARRKSGRRLSQTTRDAMQTIVDGMENCCKRMQDLLDESTPDNGETESAEDKTAAEIPPVVKRALYEAMERELQLRHTLLRGAA